MVLEIVIAVIVITLFIYGFRTGFIKSVFDLLSVFLSWILAYLLYPTVSSFLIKTPLFEMIKDKIGESLSASAEAGEQTMMSYISNLPEFLNKSLMATAEGTTLDIINSLENTLAVLAVNIISIVIIFFAVRLITFLMKVFSEGINKLFIIGPANKLLGGILGAVQGIIIVYLLAFAISFFPSSGIYSYVAEEIETSIICKKMFNEDVRILGIKPTYPVRKAEIQNEN